MPRSPSPMPDPTRRTLGQWCADVESAPDYETYLDRLHQAPADMHEAIIRHCRTAAALAQAAAERRAERAQRRRRIGLEP